MWSVAEFYPNMIGYNNLSLKLNKTMQDGIPNWILVLHIISFKMLILAVVSWWY